MTDNRTCAPSASTMPDAKNAVMKPHARPVGTGARLLALAAGLLLASGAHAQVQRSFVNLGFEEPVLTPDPSQSGQCYIITSADDVPGWKTTHPNYPGSIYPGAGATCQSPQTHAGPAIELWHDYLNFNAREGNNHAELNADQASRIYQTVCLVNGETVAWRFSHRGRNGFDSASFNIGPNPIGGLTTITSVRSRADGYGVTNSCITGGTCHVNTFQNRWADYSGSFQWTGSSGLQTVGFEAISTADGDLTRGNFIDDIQLILKPFVEFSSATYLTPEGSATDIPVVRLTGTVPAGGITIPITVTGGTATLGSDYTTPGGTANFTVTVAEGTYDLLEIPLDMTAAGDAVIDDNRTVQMAIQPSASYNLASTTTCGIAPNVNTTWTIADDDVDVAVSKSASTAQPLFDTAFTYTVTFTNNTARPTIAPLDGHDVAANMADALPAGLDFDSWTCTATNGATCPAASGTGAINSSATLPAGNGAAGGKLVYTITASLNDDARCNVINNTATVGVIGMAEGTSAAADFTTPAPGGSGNNSDSVGVTPTCANLSITKVASSSTVRSGEDISYKITARNAGPRWASGARITDPQPAGLDCSAGTLTCSNTTNGATCPTNLSIANLQGSGVTIPSFPSASSVELTLTCEVSASGLP